MLRTGDIHVDTVILDKDGEPALDTLVQVAIVPMESKAEAQINLVGAPNTAYPYSRGTSFSIAAPGKYRLEVMVSDTRGAAGIAEDELYVTTIGWQIKAAIAIVGLLSTATALWLVWLTKAFWSSRTLNRQAKLKHLSGRSLVKLNKMNSFSGELSHMRNAKFQAIESRAMSLMERLNGPYHAPALWIFMIIIVLHWMEHVLQIYQIYALGWDPSNAGGILGVIYPKLVESEILHFVYDFIQWAGIVILRPGFRGRERNWWTFAMVIQTWHFIEHVLLMGQYLTGYYFFGAAKQTSILQYWFPRAELHFVYNLLVFIPMVIAVHYYVKPKLMALAALNAAKLEEQTEGGEGA
jgi:hypothetical protein